MKGHVEDCGVTILAVFVLGSGGRAGRDPAHPLGLGVLFVFIDLKYHGI